MSHSVSVHARFYDSIEIEIRMKLRFLSPLLKCIIIHVYALIQRGGYYVQVTQWRVVWSELYASNKVKGGRQCHATRVNHTEHQSAAVTEASDIGTRTPTELWHSRSTWVVCSAGIMRCRQAERIHHAVTSSINALVAGVVSKRQLLLQIG